jgi:hypothetical protein
MDLARQSARVGAVTLPTGQISRGDFAGTSRPAEYLTFSSGTFVEAMGLEPTNLLTARPLQMMRSGVVETGSGGSWWPSGPSR